MHANDASPLTGALQALHASAALGSMIAPQQADELAASAWGAFNALEVTHVPLFEACLAVSAFVVWVAFFESLHVWIPDAVRYRLDGQLPVRPLACFTTELHKSVVPAVGYIGSIWVWQHLHMGQMLFDPVLGPKPEAFEAPTFLRVASEVSMGIFLYDLLFYPFHLSFHQLRSAGWRRNHFRHHRWGAEERVAHNAVETVQNSYVDAGIQVLINICVQQLSPWGHKHPLSRALHNLMVTYLLCEAHSGYDLPFMSHRLFPTVFGGAPRHEVHHQVGSVYFHQFFKYLDDTLGFVPGAREKRKVERKALARTTHSNTQAFEEVG